MALPLSSVTSVLYHGGGIRFGAFGGPGPQGFAVYHDLPAIYGYLVGLAQFVSGLAILFGALERIGSVCVIIVMADLSSRCAARLRHQQGRREFALRVLLVALGLVIAGPGSYSLGRILPGSLKKL